MNDGHFAGEELSTELTAPYWTALRADRFALQRCRDCARFQHYPRLICSSCGGSDLIFDEASGRGIVVAATTLHRASVPALAQHLPSVLVLVRWDEGPASLARWEGAVPGTTRTNGSGLQGVSVGIDYPGTRTSGLLTVGEVRR